MGTLLIMSRFLRDDELRESLVPSLRRRVFAKLLRQFAIQHMATWQSIRLDPTSKLEPIWMLNHCSLFSRKNSCFSGIFFLSFESRLFSLKFGPNSLVFVQASRDSLVKSFFSRLLRVNLENFLAENFAKEKYEKIFRKLHGRRFETKTSRRMLNKECSILSINRF